MLLIVKAAASSCRVTLERAFPSEQSLLAVAVTVVWRIIKRTNVLIPWHISDQSLRWVWTWVLLKTPQVIQICSTGTRKDLEDKLCHYPTNTDDTLGLRQSPLAKARGQVKGMALGTQMEPSKWPPLCLSGSSTMAPQTSLGSRFIG